MKPAFGTLRVFGTPEALAHGAADWLCARAAEAVAPFTLCLSGGSTPKRLYQDLASPPLAGRFPWATTHFFFGDERFVPPDDPDSNAHMARQAMFAKVPVPEANIHTIPTTGLAPDAAAAEYERLLRTFHGSEPGQARPLFDVTFLGVGDDGHTASLLPGQPVLDERAHLVAAVSQGRPEVRITLTYPALESSRFVVFLLQGEGKRAILDRILSGDATLPAARIRPAGEVLWFADRAAAGRWAGE
ncbi:MAG TPA: 6-phosphogluconolactonase [Acetobacteraceae bacterium]|nr:6-phosphogluconolactonase [Acetobacteraceae bacterium]